MKCRIYESVMHARIWVFVCFWVQIILDRWWDVSLNILDRHSSKSEEMLHTRIQRTGLAMWK